MLPLAILAGGFGTRLGPLVSELPKNLVLINGRPFVDWQLELLAENGFSKLVFCLSHKSEMIQDYLGDGSAFGVNIEYSLDGPSQLGTGGAIKNAFPKLGSEFGVIYGDSYLPTDYVKIEQEFLMSRKLALMTIFRNENQFEGSNVEFDKGILVNYQKGIIDRDMKHIDYGLTYFREEAFHPWCNLDSFDLASVCHELSVNGQIDGFEVHEAFYEIGSLAGIDRIATHLRERP